MLIVPYKPSTGEGGTYKRAPVLTEYTEAYMQPFLGHVVMSWQTEVGTLPPAATATGKLNGVPMAAQGVWDTGTGRVSIDYGILPAGKYLLGLDPGFSHGQVLEKAVLVARGDVSAHVFDDTWVSTNRFALKYGPYKVKSVRVPYRSYAPKTYPFKARNVQPYSTRPTLSQLWVHTLGANIAAEITPAWAESYTGMVAVENQQKYFYSDATTLSQTDPQFKFPQIPLLDGPRGVGTLGHVYNGITRRGRTGEYMWDTNGRFLFRSPTGTITTLAGVRNVTTAIRKHGGMTDGATWIGSTLAQARPVYDSRWEVVGDWSGLHGAKHPSPEPWEGNVYMRRADGTIDKRDGHEGLWCDTLAHRILFWDHWTAHGHGNYQKAHFPPAGYTPPDEPTGQTTLVDFVWTPDGLPRDYCNEPWALDVHVPSERAYWTNFGNNSIYSAKMDGTDIQLFHQGPQQPTYLQLGAANGWRLGRCSQAEVEFNRANYLRDGFISTRATAGQTIASLIKPQALKFSADYRYMYIGERYTYPIRRIDMQTGEMTTLALIPKIDSGSDSASTNDISMVIDNEGTCGPVDDIFVATWRYSRRFSKEGVDHGQLTTMTGMSRLIVGPANLCHGPDYAWGLIAPGDGQWGFVGNAAGFQDWTVTLRQPSDPTPDMNLWFGGHWQFRQTLGLDHGPVGRGRLGLPTIEDLGAMTDAALLAYWYEHSSEPVHDWSLGGAPGTSEEVTAIAKLAANGVSPDTAFLYFIRWETQMYDFSTVVPPPDTLPPSTPETDLVVTFEGYEMGMFNIKLSGTAPVNPVPELNDIASVKVYADGGPAVSVATMPGANFEVTIQHPGPGPITVEHSFADEVGNESAKFSQQIVLPDASAPMAPVEPLTLVSVVWAA